jgi:hypothetical protein
MVPFKGSYPESRGANYFPLPVQIGYVHKKTRFAGAMAGN